MPVPNPKSILKPEVVFWAFLRMHSRKNQQKRSLNAVLGYITLYK